MRPSAEPLFNLTGVLTGRGDGNVQRNQMRASPEEQPWGDKPRKVGLPKAFQTFSSSYKKDG